MNQWHVSGNANCNEITWYCTWSINKAIEEDQDVGYDKKKTSKMIETAFRWIYFFLLYAMLSKAFQD